MQATGLSKFLQHWDIFSGGGRGADIQFENNQALTGSGFALVLLLARCLEKSSIR